MLLSVFRVRGTFVDKRWWLRCLLAYAPSLVLAPSLAGPMVAAPWDLDGLPGLRLYWLLSFGVPAMAYRRAATWDMTGKIALLGLATVNGIVHGGFSFLFFAFTGALDDGWID